MATIPTSTTGSVDTVNPWGYGGRTPASEAEPGPAFELYGPGAKAANESSFRGFVALDVRNFESTTSRVYYNGVTSGITEQTLKNKEGAYLLTGYPGPMFPPVTNPADPDDQVGALLGNDTNMVVHNFDDVYAVGDRLLLAIYSRHGHADPRLRHLAALGLHPGDHRRTGERAELQRQPQRRLQQHGDPASARRRRGSAIGHAGAGTSCPTPRLATRRR